MISKTRQLINILQSLKFEKRHYNHNPTKENADHLRGDPDDIEWYEYTDAIYPYEPKYIGRVESLEAFYFALDQLTLHPDHSLQIHQTVSMYDANRHFCVVNTANGKSYGHLQDDGDDIFQHFDIPFTPMGIWQAYMLHELWRYLAGGWHGACAKAPFVFERGDIGKISMFLRPNSEQLIEEINSQIDQYMSPGILTPQVIIEGDTATIHCCRWNDWMGLVRETISVTRTANSLTFGERQTETLVKYHCGITI